MPIKIGQIVYIPESEQDKETFGVIYDQRNYYYRVFWFDGVFSEENEASLVNFTQSVQGLSDY
jgi:hypothetical protein